jgi:hypothetical protein
VISAGEWIAASGDWTNDRTHGQQFKAWFLKTSAPAATVRIVAVFRTLDLIRLFLL